VIKIYNGIKIALGSLVIMLIVLTAPTRAAANSLPDPNSPAPTALPSTDAATPTPPPPPPPYCDEWHAEYPAVVEVGSIYYAYYSGYGCKWQIYYATSSDGVHFNKQGPIAIDDGWTSQRAFPFVLYEGGLFRLYYGGGYPYQVGYAESRDGVNFSAQAQPVLPNGSDGQWDSDQTLRPSIVEQSPPDARLSQKLGLTSLPPRLYLMYYNGFGNDQSAIGLAYSSDGLSWQRYTSNPIVTTTTGIYTSFAFREAGITYLYYHTGEDLYLMTSQDGVDFTPYSADPILRHGDANTWSAGQVYGAFVRRTDAGDYVMYYNGIPVRDGPDGMIGMATSPDLIHFAPNAANPVITVGNTPANFEAHANPDGSITASWHQVTTDTTSFRLAYGEQSRVYTSSIDISGSEGFNFTPPSRGDYYLSVTAASPAERGYPAEERVVHLAAPPAAISQPAAHHSDSLRGPASFTLLLVVLIAAAEALVARQWLRRLVRRVRT
jgi:hypothetical protein